MLSKLEKKADELEKKINEADDESEEGGLRLKKILRKSLKRLIKTSVDVRRRKMIVYFH